MIELSLSYSKNLVRLIPCEDHELFHIGDGIFTIQLNDYKKYLDPFIQNGFYTGEKTELFCGSVEKINSISDVKEVLHKVSKEINLIKTGDSFYEFNIKVRKYFSYFDYSYRLKSYINYVGVDQSIGNKSLKGKCKVLNYQKLSDDVNGTFKCVFKSRFIYISTIVDFEVLCISPTAVQQDLYNSFEIPNHLLCNHNDIIRLKNFIENELSLLAFSSITELKFKLSLFANSSFIIEKNLGIPLFGKGLNSFKINEKSINTVLESWNKIT